LVLSGKESLVLANSFGRVAILVAVQREERSTNLSSRFFSAK
jgi:hypothetical protein